MFLQVLTFIGVYILSNQAVTNQINNQLIFAGKLFEQQKQSLLDSYLESAPIITNDQNFQQAIITNDKAKMLKYVHELGAHINADQIIIINLKNQIIVDTELKNKTLNAFGFPTMIQNIKKEGIASNVVIINNKIFQYVIIPIEADEVISWLGIGVELDNLFAENLQALIPFNLDVSFIHQEQDGTWKLPSTSLQGPQQVSISELLNKLELSSKNNKPFKISTKDDVNLILPLKTPQGSANARAILHYSLSQAQKPYKTLYYWLISITAFALVLAAFGALLLAKRFVRPILKLIKAVEGVVKGDYSQTVEIQDQDEIKVLANNFNEMIDAISKREQRIQFQTLHDPITQLPNRKYFEQELEKLLTKANGNGKFYTLFLIGLERMPQIIHTLGYKIGNRLKLHIGKELTNHFKDSIITARFSSNIFALLVELKDVEQSIDYAKKISKFFEKPFSVLTVNIDVSCQIGISCYPLHGQDANTLLHKADVAVYIAISSHYHYAIYNAEDDPSNVNRISLMGELREGIKTGEFVLYYHPKINLKTNRIEAVEALIRWNHPRDGLIYPGEFIPLAEETGYIRELTFWALEQAIKQCSLWRQKEIKLRVAVNLSAKDLLNPNLISKITTLLDSYGVSSSSITLEITESVIMQDTEKAIAVLDFLAAKGINFSIDDFGTGYSSLTYLKQIPAKELKLDMSFILDLINNPKDEKIVNATIGMAHDLGLRVIAEGIESEQTLELLKKYDCDFGQGNLFGKPMPNEKLIQWLKTSQWGLG